MKKNRDAIEIVKSDYIQGAFKILANLAMPTLGKCLNDYAKVLITVSIASVLLLSIDFIMLKISQLLLYGALK